MMSKEITPTPWEWVERESIWQDELVGANGDIILDDGSACGEYSQTISKEDANAKHIVKCVNENEALHARIKELESGLKDIKEHQESRIDGEAEDYGHEWDIATQLIG